MSSPWDLKSGGGQIVTHKTASKMAELGHIVHVIYTRVKDMLPVPEVNYKITWAYHFKREYLNVFSIFFALFKLLMKEKFDIVHSIEGEAILLAPFLTKRTIFLTTTHCPLFPDITSPFLFYHPISFVKHVRRYIRYYLIKMSMRFSKFAIVVSNFSKQNVASRLNIPLDKIKVILNGVSAELLECNDKRGKYKSRDTVIYFGRLDDQKGVDILIKALAYLTKKRSIKTIIVGTGWKENELKSLASSLGLLDNIDFVGMIPHEKISDYIIQADLCVFPSRRDNCPLTILEAMAIGIPVIATPVGGIPELIRDGWSGVLAEQENPQKLSEAIVDLLNDNEKREYLSNNARRYISDNLTWDKVALKYNAFYESLLKSL
jgi:glycosyltransferase involved in cell wall biosynthesis